MINPQNFGSLPTTVLGIKVIFIISSVLLYQVKEALQKMGPLLPMNIFLRQEIDRMQKVIVEVHSTLCNLKLAIDGTIVMSSSLKEALDAMYDARVPQTWKKVGWMKFMRLEIPIPTYVIYIISRQSRLTRTIRLVLKKVLPVKMPQLFNVSVIGSLIALNFFTFHMLKYFYFCQLRLLNLPTLEKLQIIGQFCNKHKNLKIVERKKVAVHLILPTVAATITNSGKF